MNASPVKMYGFNNIDEETGWETWDSEERPYLRPLYIERKISPVLYCQKIYVKISWPGSAHQRPIRLPLKKGAIRGLGFGQTTDKVYWK